MLATLLVIAVPAFAVLAILAPDLVQSALRATVAASRFRAGVVAGLHASPCNLGHLNTGVVEHRKAPP